MSITDVAVSSTPAELFAAPDYSGSIKASITQEPPTGEMFTADFTIGSVTIAALGDCNIEGVNNAVDAQIVLEYAAAIGVERSPL